MVTIQSRTENIQYVKPGNLIPTDKHSNTMKPVGLVKQADGYGGPGLIVFEDFTTRDFTDGWESVDVFTIINV